MWKRHHRFAFDGTWDRVLTALLRMLAELRVPPVGPGRARTRPDKLLADKAYSARAIRAHLRARKVTAVIPEKTDQISHRKRRGSNGGRPPRFDTVEYKTRDIIERTRQRVQELARPRHPVRQARARLPRRAGARSDHYVAPDDSETP